MPKFGTQLIVLKSESALPTIVLDGPKQVGGRERPAYMTALMLNFLLALYFFIFGGQKEREPLFTYARFLYSVLHNDTIIHAESITRFAYGREQHKMKKMSLKFVLSF